MNYSVLPSLEYAALIKIASTLCNQDDIKSVIFYFQVIEEIKIRKLESMVKPKIQQLPLPDSLKEKVIIFVKILNFQIQRWIKYQDASYGSFEFFWTSVGTIDTQKTVKVLTNNDSICIVRRYNLACIYCLEEEIMQLWNKLPESERKFFYDDENPLRINQHQLVIFWTCSIRNKLAPVEYFIGRRFLQMSPYQFAFECATKDGNEVATKYFFQKLTFAEKEQCLVKIANFLLNRDFEQKAYYRKFNCGFKGFSNQRSADVVCFLLSQMDEEQQKKVFNEYPSEVLRCLLDWPWQSLFIETAKQMWEYLSETHFTSVLFTIINKVSDFNNYWDYRKLFAEFWQQSPDNLKRHLVNSEWLHNLLLRLMMKDEENFKLVIEYAILIHKNLIFTDLGQSLCEFIVHCNKLYLLKFFFQKSLLTRDEIRKLKAKFEEIKTESEWSKFDIIMIDLLNDFTREYDKLICTSNENEFLEILKDRRKKRRKH